MMHVTTNVHVSERISYARPDGHWWPTILYLGYIQRESNGSTKNQVIKSPLINESTMPYDEICIVSNVNGNSNDFFGELIKFNLSAQAGTILVLLQQYLVLKL
jgi:hypothetical protein